MVETVKKKKLASKAVRVPSKVKATKVSSRSATTSKGMAVAGGIAYGILAILVVGAAIVLLASSFAPKNEIMQGTQEPPVVATDTPTLSPMPSGSQDQGGDTNSGY